ncbi:RNase adapter RapZ [Arenimonas daejeonensis]|uniref:RNase adapter RapZ n=1 Tax=Arenimonas daejeonensis TaxID=370777 RepID=UPI0011BF5BB0|nr:RNase adapter RapZ [Arenimonas daejeonensis]
MSDGTRPLLIVVSGMSGSGKSVALNTLEDLDFFCTDNLPAELLPRFVRSVAGEESGRTRLAVGIDVRNRTPDLARIPQWLSEVGELGFDHKLVYFDTRDEVLLKRYSDTRRKHPLSHGGLPLADAIRLERERMRPLQAIADLVMDTSELNVHQMRRQVITELGIGASQGLSLLFESFAYRRGLPADADFIFDARALPNPHWDARLRPLSGRDTAVREHLEQDPNVRAYAEQVTAFLETWIPRFEAETRSYLTVAFGCTGGRHRSVYLAERLAAHFRTQGRDGVLSFHRELE